MKSAAIVFGVWGVWGVWGFSALSKLALADPGGALIEAYIPALEAGGVKVRKVQYWSRFDVPEARFEAVFTLFRPSPLGQTAPWANLNLASQSGLAPARVDLKAPCKISLDVATLHAVKPTYFQEPFKREEILLQVIEAFRWNLGLVGVDRCKLELAHLARWPELDEKRFPAEITAAK